MSLVLVAWSSYWWVPPPPGQTGITFLAQYIGHKRNLAAGYVRRKAIAVAAAVLSVQWLRKGHNVLGWVATAFADFSAGFLGWVMVGAFIMTMLVIAVTSWDGLCAIGVPHRPPVVADDTALIVVLIVIMALRSPIRVE